MALHRDAGGGERRGGYVDLMATPEKIPFTRFTCDAMRLFPIFKLRITSPILAAFMCMAVACSDQQQCRLVGKWEIVKRLKYGQPSEVSKARRLLKVTQSGAFISYGEDGKVSTAYRYRLLASGDVELLDRGSVLGVIKVRLPESGNAMLEEVGGEDTYEIMPMPQAAEPGPDERIKAIERLNCSCGQVNETGSKFCQECGKKL